MFQGFEVLIYHRVDRDSLSRGLLQPFEFGVEGLGFAIYSKFLGLKDLMGVGFV